jgi:GAF domain-containing protein
MAASASPGQPVEDTPDPVADPDQGQDPVGGLAFPQVARLELDELLEQLVARARDVQDTQGRLRGLLRAYLKVAGAVDLDEVLGHVVSAARELVNARYAALGVVREGRLVRFVHEGMEADTVATIGDLPQGKGLLGRLVDYPQPLRLARIASHMSSVGFPEHHPPMRSFLGVPIQVAGRVFGNLYLTDKQGAEEFSPDDEELVLALATAAGLAIDNARLLDQVRREQHWQTALVEISTALVSGADPDQALRDLVHHALISARATGGGVFVPIDDETLCLTVVEGTYSPSQDLQVSMQGSLAGAALSADTAVLVTDMASDPHTATGIGAGPATIGATLAVPIPSSTGPAGVLCLSRPPGEAAFDDADQELVAVFASRAGLALGLAANRRLSEELHLLEDRGHIAEQLREQVISRLYAAGLAVQAILPTVSNPTAKQALNRHIDEVDAIIADIRRAVFGLRDTPNQQPQA